MVTQRHDERELLSLEQLQAASEPWPPGWTPRGVIDALEQLVVSRRQARIQNIVEQRLDSVTVLLDAPYDPHNAAAVMRSCDAFGVNEFHVLPGGEPIRSTRKVSQGSERWVAVREHASAEAAVLALRSSGYELVATHPDGGLVPEDLGRLPRLALMMGNEHDGLRPDLASVADHSVRIPMRGFVESLNLSVSTALLLRAATHGRPGDLSTEQLERVYARGLYRSVSRADAILAALAAH